MIEVKLFMNLIEGLRPPFTHYEVTEFNAPRLRSHDADTF